MLNSCNDQFSAAALCNSSNYNGFSDWYLPSIYELNKVYNSIHQSRIVNYLTSDPNNWYWSSTECLSNEANGAQNMMFNSGLIVTCNNKNSNMGGVIPVRTYNFNTNNNLIIWSNGETTETINVAPTQSTTYYVTANNGIRSCQDSITVTVLPTLASAIDTTVCDSIFFAGSSLTISGTYFDTIPNALGCDSVVTLNLTINQSTSSIDIITSCDSLTWIDGITYSASNNTATHTLTNSVGC
ncbi:MAG: DUF1566 domain-containing protein, partial [Parvicellaceae bacterium]